MVVTGKDYETVCTSFTVRRGSNPALTVTLVPEDSKKFDVPVPVTPQPQLSPEQRAAVEKLGLPGTITNSIGMQLVLIPDGDFMMGSGESSEELAHMYAKWEAEPGWFAREHPQHRVRITQPFYLGMHEVTVRQFRQFVKAKNYRTEAEQNGLGGYGFDASNTNTMAQGKQYNWRNPGFLQGDDHPVVIVSWNDAVAFCDWLSDQEGRRYNLPTEAQWEYACRGGTTTQFHNGDDPEKLTLVGNLEDATAKAEFKDSPRTERAVSSSDGYVFTSPVGKFQANPWGLYDTHGNVWEWCADWYADDYYAHSPASDPPGPATGSFRVSRGGSWFNSASSCRSAIRFEYEPGDRIVYMGFRVAAAMPQPPGGSEGVSPDPSLKDVAVKQAATPQQPTFLNLPTPQVFLAGDPIPRIGPLVAQCRKAVQEQDWEPARKCGALLLAAVRRGVQERTVAQVTLLCQGLRRDPPDATVEKLLQGLEAPGAFAVELSSGSPESQPAQSRGP